MLRRGLAGQGIEVTVFGNVDGALTLAQVMFAQPGTAFEDGYIYMLDGAVWNAEGFSALRLADGSPTAAAGHGHDGGGDGGKVKSVAIIIGAYDVELIRKFEAVFIAEDGAVLTALHNAVQGVFEHYDRWSDELRAVLNMGSNVQEMIDIGTRTLENPLILQDSNFSVIAVSSAYAGNPKLAPILDSNNIPYMMMAERTNYDRPDESSTVVPLLITGRHALYQNIFQQGRFQYRLLVLEMGEEFHPSTATLLEFISNYIQLAIGFVIDESKDSQALPFVMKSILSGEYKDMGFIEQRLGDFGWQSEHD
jgi:hypothetical protein